jgi:hypothetical protein
MADVSEAVKAQVRACRHLRTWVLMCDDVVQIEFYFSDANLSKDRFMTQKMSESDEGCTCSLVCSDAVRVGVIERSEIIQ